MDGGSLQPQQGHVLLESERPPPVLRDLRTAAQWGAVIILASLFASLVFPSGKDMPSGARLLSDMMGFAYMTAWSYSFYPQVLLNWKRRSVVGLSVDFQMMNLLGFASYSAYNLALFYSKAVQREYTEEFSSSIPVAFYDIAFSVHATLITAFTLAQCVIYEMGNQRFLSPIGIGCLTVASLTIAAMIVLSFHEDAGTAFSWINMLYALGFVKMAVSLTKYIPQVVMNYRRQSTIGWNIWNVLLDFSGGMLSLLQVLLDCSVTGDWHIIAGNPVKFGLGFTSIFFDVIFIIQHYILYPELEGEYHAAGSASDGDAADHSAALRDRISGQVHHADTSDARSTKC